MSKAEERLTSLRFQATTAKSFSAVADACRHASEAAGSVGTKFKCAVDESDEVVVVDVVRGGIMEWARCLVSYQPDPGGSATVSFEPLRWASTKPTFLFIPVGPESIPAINVLSKYTSSLRAEL